MKFITGNDSFEFRDLVYRVVENLESDSPKSEDEAYDSVMSTIENALIWNDDIMKFAAYYLDATEILKMFSDELIGDVFDAIDLSSYIAEGDE